MNLITHNKVAVLHENTKSREQYNWQRKYRFIYESLQWMILFGRVCVYCTCACVKGCTSCMQPVDVRLHNDSWCSCSGGLRSWERHEAVTQRCVPLSAPDAAIALWLGQPGSSTVSTQLSCLSAGSGIKVRIAEPPERNTWRTVLNSVPETLKELRRKYLWLPLLLWTTSYLSSPASPPNHKHTHTHTHTPTLTQTHASSPHPTPLTHCFCIPFFPGSN